MNFENHCFFLKKTIKQKLMMDVFRKIVKIIGF